jgi:hypothetical protein
MEDHLFWRNGVVRVYNRPSTMPAGGDFVMEFAAAPRFSFHRGRSRAFDGDGRIGDRRGAASGARQGIAARS